ncbi:MAG: hypothetical protein ACR2J9_12755, partial [Gaiellales bacterium]
LFATILAHALFYDNFFADPSTWVIAALLAAGAGMLPLEREPEPGEWIARRGQCPCRANASVWPCSGC